MKNRLLKTQKRIVPFLFAGLVIIAAVLLLVVKMKHSITDSLYEERRELLGRLTESNACVVNDNLAYGQSLMDIMTDDASHGIPEHGSLESFFEDANLKSSYKNLIFFYVDQSGKYYSSDGVRGKLTDLTYYTDSTEDSLSYISTLPHLDAETSYLIFRNRFSQPIKTKVGAGETELYYAGYLFDLDSLSDSLSRGFAGENNTFIYDDISGIMLYRDFGISLLLDGFNIYPKFSKAELLHGADADTLVQACRDRSTVVAEMTIGTEEYFFCSAPIEQKNWSVAFIVQSSYLSDVSGNSFSQIILYVSLIAGVLGAAVLLGIAVYFKSRMTAESLRKITALNRELEQATQAKSDFLSNMSHDIRTPINGIMGMTAIALGVEENPEKTRECLAKIDTASHHLLSLVNDVLDMSRIEQGRTEIVSAPMDLRMVADSCSSIIRGQLTGRSLDFTTQISCAHPRVLGDDLHLRQILINILGNAVKFTPDGGSIHFSCRETEASKDRIRVAFEVKDTGIGMSSEFIPKVFDSFTQDEGGARSRYKGTGLGMAISRQLAELMGGTIRVESQVNEGSCFTVTLPFVLNTAEPEQPPVQEPEADITGLRLLLAEDNELNMEIALELLGDAGAVLTPVEDGRKALAAFRDNPPGSFDAILMDIMMPEMTGLEATKAIRALPRPDARTIPIIAMTANAFESDVKATQEAGMNAHLVKPIVIKEVIRTIAQYTKNPGGTQS